MRTTVSIATVLTCVLTLQFASLDTALGAKPEDTEVWTPVPPRVKPGATAAEAPEDAVVLFDGTSLSQWESVKGGDAQWTVANGAFTVRPGSGDIRTKEHFGDVQLHLEWRTPLLPPEKKGQDRGNSGVFFHELYEVQILDSLDNVTYPNGQAGSIYKQHIPLVNAARPEGEWQTYDILFTAPRFNDDGAVRSPARITVLLNGVVIQHDAVIQGETTYIGPPVYKAHGEGAIRLQDHDHLVSFRNIWVRRLNTSGAD